MEALLLLILRPGGFGDEFFGHVCHRRKHYPLAFLFFPLLAWAAVRFESRGAVAFVSVICCLAINGTLHGLGTFAVVGTEQFAPDAADVHLCGHASALVLAAAVAERKSAEGTVPQAEPRNWKSACRSGRRSWKASTRNWRRFAIRFPTICARRCAPIRGFSEVLLEQYKPQLDARGQDYLRRTCDAGLQMDKLIEDLLKLSRVARSEIQRSEINLSAIAQQIATELMRRRTRQDGGIRHFARPRRQGR